MLAFGDGILGDCSLGDGVFGGVLDDLGEGVLDNLGDGVLGAKMVLGDGGFAIEDEALLHIALDFGDGGLGDDTLAFGDDALGGVFDDLGDLILPGGGLTVGKGLCDNNGGLDDKMG